MWFFNFDFFSFFFDFSWFWLDFGRPRALQKLKKIRKNRFFFAFRFEGGFWKGSGRVWGGFREGFGRILGAFWEGFGWILERFCSWVPHRIWRDMCEAFQVEDLALMIRATRGRSRRPNHMHSHLDALQAMPPVSFRRLPRDFHSVAKQASFYIAFGAHFQGFWEVWGGQLGVENRFLRVFFDIFFEVDVGIDF